MIHNASKPLCSRRNDLQQVTALTQIYAKTLQTIAQIFATRVVYTRRIAESAELASANIRKMISRGHMKTRKKPIHKFTSRALFTIVGGSVLINPALAQEQAADVVP